MSYATTADLAAYLGVNVDDLPTNAASILDQASDVINWSTLGRINITDTDQVNAAKKATCQQYEYWDVVGQDNDISGIAYKSVSIGTFSAQYSDQSKYIQMLAPRARRTLVLSGLLYRGVRMV